MTFYSRIFSRFLAVALLTFSLHVFPLYSQTQSGNLNREIKEYAILQVKQAVSGGNKVVDFFVDDSQAYWGAKVENINHKGFKVTTREGKFRVINSEVEALNYLAKEKWEIHKVYTLKAFGDMIIRYVMVRGG